MNIKGILRSSAAKLIAFAGIVGCFAGALFLTENTITDFAANGLDQMVYRFEGDFADSSYMHQQLGIMCAEMANAFEDGMDAAEFSRQHTDFAGNYFGRMGDKTVGEKICVLHDHTARWQCAVQCGNVLRLSACGLR